MQKKSFLKHNCTITSLSTNPFPPSTPPRSNWKSNLSWCCVQVERRTSSTACSLFRSLSTAHICIDLQLFLSRRDGWQLYQEADPYWSERRAFTPPLHLLVDGAPEWNRAVKQPDRGRFDMSSFWLMSRDAALFNIAVRVCFYSLKANRQNRKFSVPVW